MSTATSKIPFYLSVLVIAVLMVSTFIEPLCGTEATHRMIYGTWWFRILWGALAASGAWLCVRRRLWQQPSVALLHVSFLVILAGALTTALTSTEGSLMLYEGEETSMFLTKDKRVAHMDFTLRLDSFRIDRYAASGEPSGYRSHVSILDPGSSADSFSSADDTATISPNHILRYRRLRFYQASYTPDERGTILTIVHDPYGIGITYAGYALLFLSALWLLVPRRLKRPSTAAVVIGASAAIATLAYTLRWTMGEELLPVLRSPLLALHVGVIIMAYCLLLALVIRPSRRLLQVAMVFLLCGIFIGAIWANISWGNYWSWDPKEVWALITMLIYCLPLHQRLLPWFADERHLRLYLRLAFAAVLFTYFGVNYVLGGLHSYA